MFASEFCTVPLKGSRTAWSLRMIRLPVLLRPLVPISAAKRFVREAAHYRDDLGNTHFRLVKEEVGFQRCNHQESPCVLLLRTIHKSTRFRPRPAGVGNHVNGVRVEHLCSDTRRVKVKEVSLVQKGYGIDGRAVDDLHVRGEAAAHAL